MKLTFAVFMLVLSFAAPLAAASVDDAVNARGAAALRRLLPLVEKGAAGAQAELGLMYAEGLNVPQDYAEAEKWYRRAAEQGDSFSQRNLGLMYAEGHGVPQNYGEAAKWYRRAAEQGDYFAQYYLGNLYAEAQGVPRDYVRAYMRLSLSAMWGNPDPNAIRDRDRAARQMTPAQIAEAQKLARKWKPKKVELLETEAIYPMIWWVLGLGFVWICAGIGFVYFLSVLSKDLAKETDLARAISGKLARNVILATLVFNMCALGLFAPPFAGTIFLVSVLNYWFVVFVSLRADYKDKRRLMYQVWAAWWCITTVTTAVMAWGSPLITTEDVWAMRVYSAVYTITGAFFWFPVTATVVGAIIGEMLFRLHRRVFDRVK